MCSKSGGDFCTWTDTNWTQKLFVSDFKGHYLHGREQRIHLEEPMKATTFDVEGLVKGYLRGTAWHCTYYTPAGRQRRKLGTKNKRQAERRAREI